jgi:transposase
MRNQPPGSAGTVAVVRAACPKGTRVTRLRDGKSSVFEDEQFAQWFAAEGRGAVAPGLLALVCVLQSMENLTDREADVDEISRTRPASLPARGGR